MPSTMKSTLPLSKPCTASALRAAPAAAEARRNLVGNAQNIGAAQVTPIVPAQSAANALIAARRHLSGGIATIHHASITAAAGHTGSK